MESTESLAWWADLLWQVAAHIHRSSGRLHCSKGLAKMLQRVRPLHAHQARNQYRVLRLRARPNDRWSVSIGKSAANPAASPTRKGHQRTHRRSEGRGTRGIRRRTQTGTEPETCTCRTNQQGCRPCGRNEGNQCGTPTGTYSHAAAAQTRRQQSLTDLNPCHPFAQIARRFHRRTIGWRQPPHQAAAPRGHQRNGSARRPCRTGSPAGTSRHATYRHRPGRAASGDIRIACSMSAT